MSKYENIALVWNIYVRFRYLHEKHFTLMWNTNAARLWMVNAYFVVACVLLSHSRSTLDEFTSLVLQAAAKFSVARSTQACLPSN